MRLIRPTLRDRMMIANNSRGPAAAGGGGGSDPYFANVVLLALNDNAANGTTTFADQEGTPKTITNNGTSAYSNATAPTGMTTVGDFIASTKWLSLADSTDWDFGTSPYTLEFMVRFSSAPGANQACFGVGAASSVANFISLEMSGGKLVFFGGTGGAVTMTPAVGPSVDTWYYIAIVRNGSSWTYYVDGVSVATASNAGAQDCNGGVIIGSSWYAPSGGRNAPCLVSNVRITKGVARVIAAGPTLPFPTS